MAGTFSKIRLDVEFVKIDSFFILPGEPQKWLFVCEDQTLQIECDSKRQLSQNLKIRLNDKFGNPAECPQGVEPMVSVEHSPSRRLVKGKLHRRSFSAICGAKKAARGSGCKPECRVEAVCDSARISATKSPQTLYD